MMFATSHASAQERTVEGFRKSRFSPPVHIPPRVPLYDPGLPKSLNGKFNSTQQIRGTRPFQGQRAVIGDIRNDGAFAERPAGGLQGKIAQLVSPRSKRQPARQSVRHSRIPENRTVQQTQPRSVMENRLQQSVATAVNNYQPNRRAEKPTSSARNQVAQRPHPTVQKTYSIDRPARGGYLYKQDKQLGGPSRKGSVNIPTRVASNGGQAIVKTAAQEQIQGYSNDLQQFGTETTSSWNQPNQFQSNELLNPTVQQELPNFAGNSAGSGSNSLPSVQSIPNSQPISVMAPPETNLSLEPGSGTIGNTFESSTPYESNVEKSPYGNSLREPVSTPVRNRRFYQDEEEKDPEDYESNLDLDVDPDEIAEQRTAIPKKSCDEFRRQLLNKPITDIALDISPPARTDILGTNSYRVWRDRHGNELAQGSIADIRRGYVIVNSSNGGQVRVPYARLSESDWQAVSDYWVLPEACGLGAQVFGGRNWIPQTVNWHASSLCHKPLYFENIQLERYGHSAGPVLQPILSTGHFFERAFFFPYNTAINPPNECQYALGFYRPGDCAPWLKAPFPISLQGATRQALWYTGFGFLTQ